MLSFLIKYGLIFDPKIVETQLWNLSVVYVLGIVTFLSLMRIVLVAVMFNVVNLNVSQPFLPFVNFFIMIFMIVLELNVIVSMRFIMIVNQALHVSRLIFLSYYPNAIIRSTSEQLQKDYKYWHRVNLLLEVICFRSWENIENKKHIG